MATPFLLIDGYNLMHACSMCRRSYGVGQFEVHRNRFLRYLANHLSEAERRRAVVVFDAQNAPGNSPRSSQFEDMQILFASGSDADTLIEQLIVQHSAPRQVILVSSDHRLQKAARKRRARSVDSEVFADELERHGPISDNPASKFAIQTHPKYTGVVSEEETKRWRKIFESRSDAGPQTAGDTTQGDVNDPAFWNIDIDALREEEQEP
ncbi:MAG: NYN domain-containing protein [Planctomycetaceae bacterium]